MAQSKTPKDKNTAMFLVVVLLLTLVGAGTGFAVGSLIQPVADVAEKTVGSGPAVTAGVAKAEDRPKEAQGASAEGHGTAKDGEGGTSPAGEEESVEAIDPHSLKTVVFPPVLTTLAEPKGKWIRLEGSILITAEAEEPPEVLAERSGEQILTYLRSLRLDQLEGPTSILGLREDLTEMLRVLSKGQVKGILINGLVIE